MYYDMYGNEYGSQEEANQADASYNAQMNGAGGGNGPPTADPTATVNPDISGGATTPGARNDRNPTTGGLGSVIINGDEYVMQPDGRYKADDGTIITQDEVDRQGGADPTATVNPNIKGGATTPGARNDRNPSTGGTGNSVVPSGSGIGDSLLKNFGLSTGKDGIDWSHADWSKILGAGFGAATLAHGLNQQPYSPTSAADLLKKQPSNTPTWSADQTAAMRQPLQLGNHPGGSAGGSSIVAGSSMPLTLSQFGQQPNAAPQQLPTTLSPLGAGYQATRSHAFAEGGSVSGALSMMGDSGQAFSGAVQGDDPGQSDLIDAKLSAGEYVLDAETVSMLGDGNTAAGVAKLDELRQKLREQKRSAPNGEIPDTVQGPLTSLLGGQANG